MSDEPSLRQGEKPMRVLVCGGRDFDDWELLSHSLIVLSAQFGRKLMIIHGGARGADRLAANWAFNNRMEAEAYPADWNRHGRKAGPLRNQQMLDDGRPEYVAAFPGGRGTADMVRRAKSAGIHVFHFDRGENGSSPTGGSTPQTQEGE